jgi:RluA family pseudouridine synthase
MKSIHRAIDLLHEDDDLLVVAKPAGVPSVHDGNRPDIPNLIDLLQPAYGGLWPVHRLDLDTSGVILFARTEAAHRALSAQFETRAIEKTYHALLVGSPVWAKRDVDAPLLIDGDRKHRTVVDAKRGKPALTRFVVLEKLKSCALVEASPETGRTHQIRAHAAQLGHPIVADALYGDGKPIVLSALKRGYRANADEHEERPLMGRVALHALRLTLAHPTSGDAIEFEAPYAKDFGATVNQLRKL